MKTRRIHLTRVQLEKAVKKLESNAASRNVGSQYDAGVEVLEVLRKTNHSQLQIRVLLAVADSARNLGRTDEALRLIIETKKASRASGDASNALLATRKQAFLNLQLFHFKEAEELAWEALYAARTMKSVEQESGALAMLGHLCEVRQEFGNALVYFRDALSLAEISKQVTQQITCLSDIGRILGIQGELSVALDFYEKSLRLAKRQRSQKHILLNLYRRGDIYRVVGDFSKAEQMYVVALEQAIQLGLVTEIAEIKGRLIRLFVDRKEYKSAIEAFRELDLQLKAFKYERHDRYNRLVLAEALNGLGSYNEAIDILWTMIDEITPEFESNHVQVEQVLELLATALANMAKNDESAELMQLIVRFRQIGPTGIYTAHQQALLRRQLYIETNELLKLIRSGSRTVFAAMGVKVNLFTGEITWHGVVEDKFTTIELKIFKLLVARQGNVVNNRDIIASYEPGARDFFEVPRRAHEFVMNMRRKLHVRNLIVTSRGVGYFIPKT